MSFSESGARGRFAQALSSRGWTEDLVAVDVKLSGMLVDYILSVKVTPDAHPFPVALVEFKSFVDGIIAGVPQAKYYMQRLNFHLAFVTDGSEYLNVEEPHQQHPIQEFPTPDELRKKYELTTGFSLDSATARPLLAGGQLDHSRLRYFQEAAIRSVHEEMARGTKRIRLVMAAGTGHTLTLGELLKRISEAGQLKRALFLTERRDFAEQVTIQLRDILPEGVALIGPSEDLPLDSKVLVACWPPTSSLSTDMLSHIIIDEPSVWSRYADFLSQHTESVVVVCSTKTLEGLSSLGAPAYQYDLQRAVADGFIAPVTVRRFGAAVAPDPEELERMTRDFVLNRLADLFHGHPLADLVADLLRVIGYKTRVSPPGPDGGVDIVAHKDHLGIESPIIKVQVKSSAKTVGHADVASLYGNTCPGEFALFVTLGAFSSQSRYYARGKSNLRLISGPEFVDLLMEHYEALDAQFRAYIPMKRVFIPLVLDEQGEAPNSSETTRKLETKRRRNGGAPRNSVKGGREPE